MRFRRRPAQLRADHEPVLGTRLSVVLRGPSERRLAEAEAGLLAELDRLEAMLSAHRDDSELSRWRRGPAEAIVSPELAGVLALALRWQERTDGIFNPAVGELSDRWRAAASDGVVPSDDELAALAAAIRAPRYEVDGRTVRQLGDCRRLNVDAVAKGHVVDLAARHVIERWAPTYLLVNVGGDLVHHGDSPVIVAVEDPQRAYDNATPLDRVALQGAGFATSGSARRGVSIGGAWFSHVIDPRTGRPVDSIASASVLAADAATADAVATLASVAGAAAGAAFVDALPAPAACLVVDRDGTVHTSARWAAARFSGS